MRPGSGEADGAKGEKREAQLAEGRPQSLLRDDKEIRWCS